MRMYDIIKKKRDGYSLSTEEIDYFIHHYTNGDIPDYQAAALLMAIYINKMDDRETLDLTKAMINSGETVELSDIKGIKVDKHSTGGVGDTVTLILGPLVAACGIPFVKMSGRGLGHTGGTLDKLEAIKGFRIDLEKEELINNTNEINISISSQTANITPADKKIYAIRDVTATVENLSLIASSIMSKKLAIGSNGIILDVKVGSGAFMKNIQDGKALAQEMVKIGKGYGRETIAVITNMDEPLGKAVGNILEVKEAIQVLQGQGPKDIYELTLILGSKLLVMAKRVEDEEEGRKLLDRMIDSGKAIEKLKEMVKHQGGDIEYIDDPSLFPEAKYILEAKSLSKGFVKDIDGEEIGKLALFLGAGRETLDTELDMTAGIVLNKKVGDKVEEGEILAYIHCNDLDKAKVGVKEILNIYKLDENKTYPKDLILGEIK